MRIFLAGGSGVMGTRLIPLLVAAGHEVTATTRDPGKLDGIRALGADAVVVDAYDAPQLASAVADAGAELVMHQMTDLSDFDTDANARLRRAGTANLVAAARDAGVERMMVQSITWAYQDGERPAVEDDPIQFDSAIRIMEDLVCRIPHATVLRYGTLYGPGTWYAPGGRVANAVTAGLLPATGAVSSFVHIDDAIAATVQALAWPDGAYNIVDDEPAPATEWLPVYAEAIGAPRPAFSELPEGVPRGRGASNAKARTAGWVPAHPTWREGFARP